MNKATMRGHTLRSGHPANSMDQDSFDSYDDAEDMLVMSTQGLNISGDGESPRNESESTSLNTMNEESELPKSLIVTNVDTTVFDNEDIKANFENMFREFGQSATFHYLRSFRRIRIGYGNHVSALQAKTHLHNTPVGSKIIHCFFLQVLSTRADEDAFLAVPPLEKQFLISPPSSPPVGWETAREDRPVVNMDLIAAVSQLTPGENYELQPSKEVTVLGKSISTPSITVDVCGEGLSSSSKMKIQQTKCPERKSSLD
ncbi:calcipressin-2 isoform X2 [Lepeophtheirus salmonis]|uniref:calcipressin-2 isoform X2 n=1 Tax=Lepeophtheirus salmonis TaxID=72036 RepID=UPI00077F7836